MTTYKVKGPIGRRALCWMLTCKGKICVYGRFWVQVLSDVPVLQNQLPRAELSQPERESGVCVCVCVCVHAHACTYTPVCVHSDWNVSRDETISASPRSHTSLPMFPQLREVGHFISWS